MDKQQQNSKVKAVILTKSIFFAGMSENCLTSSRITIKMQPLVLQPPRDPCEASDPSDLVRNPA